MGFLMWKPSQFMSTFINGPKSSSNFSRSARNQELKLCSIVIIMLVKRTNGSHFDIGAHKVQKIKSKGPHFVTHISRLANDQRFTIDCIASLGILKTSNSSDFDVSPQNLKEKRKKWWGLFDHYNYSSVCFRLLCLSEKVMFQGPLQIDINCLLSTS